MFGLGFWEIVVIMLVAIIALGPEKLPSAMVDVAKFFKKVRSMFEDAKTTIDNELKLTDMKAEAEKYKTQYENLKNSINNETIDNFIDNASSAEKKQKNDSQVVQNPEILPQQTNEIKEKVTFSQNLNGDKHNA
jgi:sec-independent protein translocase protein TatB